MEFSDVSGVLEPVRAGSPGELGVEHGLVWDLEIEIGRVSSGHIDCLSRVNEGKDKEEVLVGLFPSFGNLNIHSGEIEVVGPGDSVTMASDVWDGPTVAWL